MRLGHANALGEGGLCQFAFGEQGVDVGAERGHSANLCGLPRQCTFGLNHRVILNSHGVVPTEQPSIRAVRFAISAGPLHAVRMRQRQDEAARQGAFLLDVLSTTELVHLQMIRNAMAVEATWEDAVAAIEAGT